MLRALQSHPLPVSAHFEFSLVLTYALPRDALQPLLPPGLELDAHGCSGFLAVALVQARRMRPSFLPAICGRSFFLTGYRIFARYQSRSGRRLRGLRILRSYADSPLMIGAGNLLTHYAYRRARVCWRREKTTLAIGVTTPRGEADIAVAIDTAKSAELPPGSPFSDWREARRFAGPLPFTFDYEPEARSMVLIEGVRSNWRPQPVEAEVARLSFLDQPQFAAANPVLASAFLVQEIPYRWKRGVREPLENRSA